MTTSVANATAAGAATPSTSTRIGSNEMGKDQFVKLLLAQLGNQDPTAPVDSQAFVAQLAQFSSVELLQSANSSLDSLIMAQAAGNQTSVVSLVGKDAIFKGESVSVTADGTGKITADLSGNADTVTVVIKDQNGKTVRTATYPKQAAGRIGLEWDGKDDNGKHVAAGDYKVQITAATADGKNVAVTQRISARIDGVSYVNGYPELLLSTGQRVKLADVVEVSQPKQPQSP
jgi:flagellar basal-body rod modification protein FlgD